MDHAPGEHDWGLVAEYIDTRDLDELRREWWKGDDTRFVQVAIHVASCIPCSKRRLDRLEAWAADDTS